MDGYTTNHTGISALSRTVGVAVNAQTYKNLLYLLLRFPLGIVYLTIFVTGISLGAGLVPLLVGVPILGGVLAVAGYVGVVEAALLRTLLDRDITCSTADLSEKPIVPYFKTVVTTPKNYLLLVLAFVSFATGNALFVALVTGFALSLALVATPVTYLTDGVQTVNVAGPIDLGIITINEGQLSINTIPEALLLSLIGVILTFVGLHLVNLTTRAYAGVTESVLSAME